MRCSINSLKEKKSRLSNACQMQFFSTVETIPWIKKKNSFGLYIFFPFQPQFSFLSVLCVGSFHHYHVWIYKRRRRRRDRNRKLKPYIYARFMYNKCSQTLIELIYIFDQNEFSLWSRLIYIEGYTIAHYRGTLAGTWVSCAGPYVSVSRICMGSALVAIPEGRLCSLQTMCVCECAHDFFFFIRPMTIEQSEVITAWRSIETHPNTWSADPLGSDRSGPTLERPCSPSSLLCKLDSHCHIDMRFWSMRI